MKENQVADSEEGNKNLAGPCCQNARHKKKHPGGGFPFSPSDLGRGSQYKFQGASVYTKYMKTHKKQTLHLPASCRKATFCLVAHECSLKQHDVAQHSSSDRLEALKSVQRTRSTNTIRVPQTESTGWPLANDLLGFLSNPRPVSRTHKEV